MCASLVTCCGPSRSSVERSRCSDVVGSSLQATGEHVIRDVVVHCGLLVLITLVAFAEIRPESLSSLAQLAIYVLGGAPEHPRDRRGGLVLDVAQNHAEPHL